MLSAGHAAAVKWGPLVQANLRDREAALSAIRWNKITSAIHCAAFSLVGEGTKSVLNRLNLARCFPDI